MKRGDWQKLQPGDLIRNHRGELGMIDSVRPGVELNPNVCEMSWRFGTTSSLPRISNYPSYGHAGALSDAEAAWAMKCNLT